MLLVATATTAATAAAATTPLPPTMTVNHSSSNSTHAEPMPNLDACSATELRAFGGADCLHCCLHIWLACAPALWRWFPPFDCPILQQQQQQGAIPKATLCVHNWMQHWWPTLQLHGAAHFLIQARLWRGIPLQSAAEILCAVHIHTPVFPQTLSGLHCLQKHPPEA